MSRRRERSSQGQDPRGGVVADLLRSDIKGNLAWLCGIFAVMAVAALAGGIGDLGGDGGALYGYAVLSAAVAGVFCLGWRLIARWERRRTGEGGRRPTR